MTTERPRQYDSYAAPKHHGEKLLEPALNQVPVSISQAKEIFERSASGISLGSSTLKMSRHSARVELLQAARRYSSAYRDLPQLAEGAESTIILGGHQPELFHCGVWFKNFVLSRIGQAYGATPIHFIVDNDLCRFTGIQVPQILAGEVSLGWVDFDRPCQPMPWENRRLQDAAVWRSFPTRVHQACAKLKDEPLLGRLWQYLNGMDLGQPLGCLLSQARHMIERDLGWKTLEIPLSDVVSTTEFAQFSVHLLTHLDRFQQIYNDELEKYRQAHRIRNHAQPLPDLATAQPWLEAPFWCYSAQSTNREPLWLCHQAGRILLSDHKGWEFSIEATDFDSTVEQWIRLLGAGVRIRPRALITTMYARLMLSDLFIHGIGGGKYDQVMDRIISEFFDLTPPPFLVASATMYLPFDDCYEITQARDAGRLQLAQQQFNAVSANPELLLQTQIASLTAEQRGELAAAAKRKQDLLKAIPSKGEKWEWHLAMKKAKQQLAELAQPHIRILQAEAEKLRAIANQQALLDSREYSFCLFSLEEITRNFR